MATTRTKAKTSVTDEPVTQQSDTHGADLPVTTTRIAENTALAVHPQTASDMAMSSQDLARHTILVQEAMKNVMIEGTH